MHFIFLFSHQLIVLILFTLRQSEEYSCCLEFPEHFAVSMILFVSPWSILRCWSCCILPDHMIKLQVWPTLNHGWWDENVDRICVRYVNIGPPESPWHVLPVVIEQISDSDIFLQFANIGWSWHSSLDMMLEFATCNSWGIYARV